MATATADADGHGSSHLEPLALAWMDQRARAGHRGGLGITAKLPQGQGRRRGWVSGRHSTLLIDAYLEQVYGID